MECSTCGLTAADLPDGVDPEFVFEDGECLPCSTGSALTVVF
jgi:hypothetical protein